MITIRTAETSDAAAIGSAHARAWQVAYKGIIADAYLDAIDVDTWSDRWLRILTGEIAVDGIKPPENIVAVFDDEVIGFANAGRFRGAPDDPEVGELWAMYVHPDHWKTGAGYELMKATMSIFYDCDFQQAHLWVLSENTLARRFYERQGWVTENMSREEEIGGGSVAEVRYRIELKPA